MAKTIEEMMKKSFWDSDIYEHPGIAFEDGYRLGANSVLEEIESILDAPMSYVVESGWQGQLNDLVGMIRHKINELKGM